MAPTTVRIFDMAGHLIRTLVASKDLAPGSNVTTWDGRDQDGRSVFAGTYALNPGTNRLEDRCSRHGQR